VIIIFIKRTKVMNIHLNLHKKWFYKILAGEKLEEYREITDYWCRRLLQCDQDIKKGEPKYECKKASCHSCLTRANGGRFKNIRTITFSNGYAKDRPQFVIKCHKIEVKQGSEKWGAEPGKKYFVFHLGLIKSVLLHKPTKS